MDSGFKSFIEWSKEETEEDKEKKKTNRIYTDFSKPLDDPFSYDVECKNINNHVLIFFRW